MNKKLHILHLEDSKADAEIIQAKLAKGASDYVLKNNLTPLVPSVNRALEETKLIAGRKGA